MWQYLEQQYHVSGDAVKNYAIAASLTTAPAWVHWVSDFATPILTFVCVLTGAIVGIRQLVRDLRKPVIQKPND